MPSAVRLLTGSWPVIIPWMLGSDDTTTDTMTCLGAMPDAIVTAGPFGRDRTGVFDNHPWVVLTYDNPTGAIWIVAGPAITSGVGGWSH